MIRGSDTQNRDDAGENAMPEQDVALEHCPKCNTLLDVSGCRPLTETSCPSCGALIKILREFHHFVLLSEIGQGGAGTVFRAFDETLERDVALKLLRNENTSDPKYLEGLEQEALVMASISHPHVVKVYSTGRKSGFFYIAMEIVPGGSLADRITRPVRPSEADVLSYGIQLAEGLNAAYERGLLHRDVKPGNILFADQETIKVADFGLALRVEHATDDADDIWGTPDYIAPEKLLRQGEDLRSDIYSLGCTLFHCLTGVPPLDTTTVWKVVETQRAEAAPDIQQLSPEVSGATAFVIKRCLEKNPADRYQNYHELIEHLKYAREQMKPPGIPPLKGTSAPVADVPQPKKWLWIAVAAVVAVLACAGLALAAGHKKNSATMADVASAPATAKAPKLERYIPVNMKPAFTCDTRRPMYQGQAVKNILSFPQYGVTNVNGVPFEVADPEKTGTGLNITILEGHKMPFPKKVEIPVAAIPVRRLHILGGVAAWGVGPSGQHQHPHEAVARAFGRAPRRRDGGLHVYQRRRDRGPRSSRRCPRLRVRRRNCCQ